MVPRTKLLTSSTERQILRAALDVVEDPVFVKDDQHRVVITNRAGCLLLARPIDQVLGRTDRDFMPAQQAQRHFATDQKILETGKPEQYEETLTDASGRVRDLLTRKRLIQDSRGQKFVLAHITDLTEFRRAEA